MIPIVLHATSDATASAIRSPNGVIPGLRGNDLLLQTRQQQLPFGQGQPKWAISTRSLGRLIVTTSMDCFSPSAPAFTNLTIQATRPPPIRDQTRNYRLNARTPNLQAVPRTGNRRSELVEILVSKSSSSVAYWGVYDPDLQTH
jgi:hypothetical protein